MFILTILGFRFSFPFPLFSNALCIASILFFLTALQVRLISGNQARAHSLWLAGLKIHRVKNLGLSCERKWVACHFCALFCLLHFDLKYISKQTLSGEGVVLCHLGLSNGTKEDYICGLKRCHKVLAVLQQNHQCQGHRLKRPLSVSPEKHQECLQNFPRGSCINCNWDVRSR